MRGQHGVQGRSARTISIALVILLMATLTSGSVVHAVAERALPGRSISEQTTADGLSAVATALGSDAEGIFRFVADDIRYEPYSGALRGAAGTFASRAGTSVDQASL